MCVQRLQYVYKQVLRYMCEQCSYSEQYMVGSQQGVPSVDRFGPAGCPGVNSPRGILSSHSHMSPESVRLMHRHRSVTHRYTKGLICNPSPNFNQHHTLHIESEAINGFEKCLKA